MAINFPDSPTLNQVFSAGGRTWKWDGQQWLTVGGSGLPNQAGNAGKLLTTNGSEPSWTEISSFSTPYQPSITSPANGTTGLGPTIAFTSSAFASALQNTHVSSTWQVATDSAFTNIISSTTADTTNKTSWVSAPLAASGTYYARVRYTGASGGDSPWSSTVTLQTKAVYFARMNGFAWYELGASSPDSYYSLNANGTDGTVLSGNTGYTRQTNGTPVIPYAQAMMRRCVLRPNASGVLYYLDADDSTKIAGSWSGSAQTGWLRVHEGFNDPVRPLPGQGTTGNSGLRSFATAWSSGSTYSRGDLVTHNGRLWVSLSDTNTNITPASGTSNATLDGSVGQVMVEIPRFYVYYNYNSSTKRHAWDIIVDPVEVKPFPNLSVALAGATTTRTDSGLTFTVHPAFQKAGVERSHRYYAAYRAFNNGGTGQSRSGVTWTVSQTRSVFRTQARALNGSASDPTGVANNAYGPMDWYLRQAVNLLLVSEYRTFYSQAVLGAGNVDGGDYAKTTGRSNPSGNASGAFNSSGALVTPSASSTTDDGVMYRGIEDYWGSSWLFVDGVNFQGTGSAQTVFLSNNPSQFADDTSSNYSNVGALAGSSGGYPAAISQNSLFIPTATGGSTTTYLTDIMYADTTNAAWRIALVGGAAGNGAGAGAFCLDASSGSTSSGTDLGGSLSR